MDDVVDTNRVLTKRLLDVVDAAVPGPAHGERRQDLDQLARDALLAQASDWAFMVTKDSAAQYARERDRPVTCARSTSSPTAIARGARGVPGTGAARAVAAAQRSVDGPFAHMDARLLARADRL